MISFDEYMGFSDPEEAQEKKPGKIRQFFRKHGKKIAVGAGMLGAGILGYMIGRRGFGSNTGKGTGGNANGNTNGNTNTVAKPAVTPKPTPVVNANTTQNNANQRPNGLSDAQMQQLNAQANTRARQNTMARYSRSPAIYSPNFKIARQIKANNKRFGTA